MKSVLLSARPKWCEKICHVIGKEESGKPIYEKRIEVRKTAPKEVPFKCYIYMTQGTYKDLGLYSEGIYQNRMKVIGEFICDKVYKWDYDYCDGVDIDDDLIVDTCLDREDINIYAKGKTLYGWHISDLKIYDKPKELSELWGRKNCLAADTVECWNCFAACREINGRRYQPLSRPPQSWCYIEETALHINFGDMKDKQ